MTYDFSVLRELRKRRKLTIAKLSELSGVSYVAISKLERNKGNPELKTLDHIAQALAMPTHSLLALVERQRPISAKAATRPLLQKGVSRHVDLAGTRIFYITAPKGASGVAPEFHHDDYEHCFVLDGKVRTYIRGTPYTLGPGDALQWDCIFEHSYEVLEDATFITVLTPKRP